jgi:hypothetical protein
MLVDFSLESSIVWRKSRKTEEEMPSKMCSMTEWIPLCYYYTFNVNIYVTRWRLYNTIAMVEATLAITAKKRLGTIKGADDQEKMAFSLQIPLVNTVSPFLSTELQPSAE